MNIIRILDISDMQNGFTQKNGNLYVQDAFEIIKPINQFLRLINKRFFDYILIVQDTHFSEEYYESDESSLFPIHCEYGTKDWDLSIDVSGLKNIWFFSKNKFDMWSTNGLKHIVVCDERRKVAYENLFHFVDNPHDPEMRIAREDFFTSHISDFRKVSLEVTIIGVASDICNRFAMEGWLALGAKVTIISDLTKGIQKETSEILNEKQYEQYKDRLRSVTCTEYMQELPSLRMKSPKSQKIVNI